eukprot:CAMPEP_0118944382 /NCGR_PEP_ID=MMETSP1169-20130426/40177_1 /TAXON_ID=36882 /ORGANISM="Pyramimonas obovata, Strain CCMP722" /LENGTH=364 /DNA_ID=CAMNT_0006889855 /DNA_START=574 /DNA_END=1668 /DNA_ORIENTATION=+
MWTTEVEYDENEGPLEPVAARGVSIVIAVYNELKNLPLLIESVAKVMKENNFLYEIICVDDGSTDGSTQLLKAMSAERDDLTTIIFRRNFGQTAALAAGIKHAQGLVLVTMDADLQNDPADIPKMLEHMLAKDLDLVCGWRKNRKDNLLRTFPSRVANAIIARMLGVAVRDTGCTLKVWRMSLAKLLRPYGEMHRFLPALAAMEGAAIGELPVNHLPRTHGKSKYSALGRVPRVVLDLLTLTFMQRFRDRPVQLIGGLAIFCLLIATGLAAYGAIVVSDWLPWLGLLGALGHAGPQLVLALELTVAALQLVCLAFVADIAARTFYESQRRSVYRIRDIVASAPRGSNLVQPSSIVEQNNKLLGQ